MADILIKNGAIERRVPEAELKRWEGRGYVKVAADIQAPATPSKKKQGKE